MKICVIINPASGIPQPILYYLNKELQKTNYDWEVKVTKKAGDAFLITKKAVREKVNRVVVYGGDGTVIEVAKALYKSKIPVAIIPGGTANVIAKELQLPLDIEKATQFALKKQAPAKNIDMGLASGTPMLLGFNIGIFAKAVLQTSRKAKIKQGPLAYGFSLFSLVTKTVKNKKFDLFIDNKKIVAEGIALLVTNIGNFGIPGLSVVPNVSIEDGELDVILIENINLAAFTAFIKGALTQQKPLENLKHWQGKAIKLKIPKSETVVCDDLVYRKQTIKITASPKSLKVIAKNR